MWQEHSSEQGRYKSQAMNTNSWVGQMHTVQLRHHLASVSLPLPFQPKPATVLIQHTRSSHIRHRCSSLALLCSFFGQRAVVRQAKYINCCTKLCICFSFAVTMVSETGDLLLCIFLPDFWFKMTIWAQFLRREIGWVTCFLVFQNINSSKKEGCR